MALIDRIPGSLKRLFPGNGESGERSPDQWISWFNDPLVKQGRLNLVRADEDLHVSRVLDAKTDPDGSLFLIVDRLIPLPEVRRPDETVSFHASLEFIDNGSEVTTTFRALFGEEILHDGNDAVRLVQIADIRVESREYVATLSDTYGVGLSMFLMGEWVEVWPEQATINRFIFDADLDVTVGLNGLSVPKAMVTLGEDLPEVPVRLLLKRRIRPAFETVIEKIDSAARMKLTAIIEEIWRTEAGFSTRKMEPREPVGYRERKHDVHADSFKPHILLLDDSVAMRERFEEFGVVRVLRKCPPAKVAEAAMVGRCDLIVGDRERWGTEAVHVERALRAAKRTRNIPRFWIVAETDSTSAETDSAKERLGKMGASRLAVDILEYGAFDLIRRDEWNDDVRRKVAWALGGREIGSGPSVALFTRDDRIRYRIGLELAAAGYKVAVSAGVVSLALVPPYLDKKKIRRLVLDLSGPTRIDSEALEKLIRRLRSRDREVLLLVRQAKKGEILSWLKAGASDIVLLDASLKKAAQRIRTFVHGGGRDE